MGIQQKTYVVDGKIYRTTPKKEKFIEHFLVNRQPVEAYKHAYNVQTTNKNSLAVSAGRLLSDPIVLYRLKQRENEIKMVTNVSVGSLTAEAQEAFEIARKGGNASAMVAAITLKAKLNGIVLDKREINQGVTVNLVSYKTLEPAIPKLTDVYNITVDNIISEGADD